MALGFGRDRGWAATPAGAVGSAHAALLPPLAVLQVEEPDMGRAGVVWQGRVLRSSMGTPSPAAGAAGQDTGAMAHKGPSRDAACAKGPSWPYWPFKP